MSAALGLWMYNLVPKLFGLCYVSGITSLSLHLSPFMGIFGLVLVMFFHNQDHYLMQNTCFRFVLVTVLWVDWVVLSVSPCRALARLAGVVGTLVSYLVDMVTQ